MDEIPWITDSAALWLGKNLKRKMNVFEWGSGGSTFFISKRVKSIISIEHDTKWYRMMKQIIRFKDLQNISYKLIRPERGNKIPLEYKSSDESFSGKTFQKYCESILDYSNEFFDLVVVDGRARVGCVQKAVDKVKRGGYLILDNSEREEYKKAFSILKNWKRVDFEGFGPLNSYPWRTTVFQKSA